ncbi:putative mitochondrial protein [Tanacetum coccineum]
MFKPQTLANAYSLAKFQFATNDAIKKKNKVPLLLVSRFNTYTSGPTINSPKQLALLAPNANWRNKPSTSQTVPLRRRLTKKELEEKRAKNQSFYYNEELDSEEEILIGASENREIYEQVLEELPHISLHALNGVQNYQTMRVVGDLILCDEASTIQVSSLLDPLLDTYADVFKVLTSLPPKGSHDHRIPLKEYTQPINIRPYSQSSFSSPVGMVKKKDGSWRMCLDYKQLNKQTMKDKFPIPIIKELIDELHGSVIFFKLDLRSDYHQIRMYEDDIAKTSFKTHEPFLRKFTLVFFDDILVYSPDMESHLEKDGELHAKMKQLETNPSCAKHYLWAAGQLLRKGKLVIGKDELLRKDFLLYFHVGPEGGHSGMQSTTKKLCAMTKISMDFIDGLPMSKGGTVITVIVDRLSKYNHFIPLTHPYTAIQVAQAFLDNIYRLHRLPRIIVSDKDVVFMSRDELKEWLQWISLAEYWYNTSYHTAIKTTHFQAVYGQPPPAHISYNKGGSMVEAVDTSLVARETAIQLLKFHIKRHKIE